MMKPTTPYLELARLVLLRVTVFLAELAIRNRRWLLRAKTYAPLMAGTAGAYLLGRMVGLALIQWL
ncbi:MAG TPA: hypothetical protein VI410_02870 [Anaerolineales bacterium]|nr:hypothetical protein [Anaerolineales bacterium]